MALHFSAKLGLIREPAVARCCYPATNNSTLCRANGLSSKKIFQKVSPATGIDATF
jgi:hypothetical protein